MRFWPFRTERYVCRSETPEWALEVSFRGGAWEHRDGRNPRRTDVRVTGYQAVDYELDCWIQKWSRSCGHLEAPGGPWHGFQLTAIVGEALYAGLGNALTRLANDTGSTLWRRETGNTAIGQILAARSGQLLYVQNGYYGFEGGSNLCAVTPAGKIAWRAELPNRDEVFANRLSHEDDGLVARTWHGTRCVLSESTGKILAKSWSR